MSQNKLAEKTPFWVDSRGMSKPPDATKKDWLALVRMILRLLFVPTIIIVLSIFDGNDGVSNYLLCIAGFYLIMGGFISFAMWRYRVKSRNSIDIQERARTQTGSSHIGSAIHVAGHPILERDQQVVLAISQGRLSFYSYDSPIPLDSLELADIQCIELIGYNDERVPIRGVVDSSAQVLEIIIDRGTGKWTCLFRKMRPVRPIDWYHAIQQAKYRSKT